jgi:hypothetical protein
MKKIIALSGLLLVVALTLSPSFDAHAYDFFGNDIAGLDVQNVNQCAAACNANPRCLAWTFVKAGRMGPTARCFLKNPIPSPSFNATCPTNAECLSGVKRSDGWCGETPLRAVQGNQNVLGQGQVLSCPSGQSCRPRILGGGTQVCWFLFFPYPCKSEKIQTTDFFCQAG